jgi:SAM-dependent methyltransferase
MSRPDWAPEGIELSTPSVARIYDHWLGGGHNFAADREMSQKILSVVPHFRFAAQANRAFLFRAVRFLVDAGIRQFLDLGSGIPTVGNVHEVAQKVAPESRVVYVDIDPVAAAHSQQLLAGNDRATAIERDVRDPQAILDDPQTRALLDLDQPVGLLMVAVLHYLPDADDPYAIVSRYRRALCPGSYVAIAHGTEDEQPAGTEEAQRLTRQTRTPLRLRGRAEIEPFFDGLELVEPGLVWAPLWRPDDPADLDEHPQRSVNYVGLARVR